MLINVSNDQGEAREYEVEAVPRVGEIIYLEDSVYLYQVDRVEWRENGGFPVQLVPTVRVSPVEGEPPGA